MPKALTSVAPATPGMRTQFDCVARSRSFESLASAWRPALQRPSGCLWRQATRAVPTAPCCPRGSASFEPSGARPLPQVVGTFVRCHGALADRANDHRTQCPGRNSLCGCPTGLGGAPARCPAACGYRTDGKLSSSWVISRLPSSRGVIYLRARGLRYLC
jgi:hypothetical protein